MNDMNNGLRHKAEKLISEYKMIESADKVLVAFSGGGDSSALLFFLLEYLNKDNIFAAHLNHMIRGAEAERDEKFAVDTCEKYNIKIFTERRDIPKIAENSKKSIEEAARDERYSFLRETANSMGKNVKIATAHTASDNAETVIFNLARGCGLTGLAGIAPVRDNIIRPFLSCAKEDILEYCEKNNIAYIEDSTNADENYTRNFIRCNISSKLKEKFGRLDENIFKTSEILRRSADFIDQVADSRINDSEGICVGDLLTMHRALQQVVIERLYENAVLPDNRKLEYKHVEYVSELLTKHSKAEKSVDLPGLVSARVSKNKLTMEKISEKKTSRNRK